ncbi:MAG: DUF4924 family protein [Butyricimonas faecihominis]
MMRKEEVTKSGHVQVVKNMVNELTELHFHLLHNVQDMKYKQLFMMARIICWIIAGRRTCRRRFPMSSWHFMLFMVI